MRLHLQQRTHRLPPFLIRTRRLKDVLRSVWPHGNRTTVVDLFVLIRLIRGDAMPLGQASRPHQSWPLLVVRAAGPAGEPDN